MHWVKQISRYQKPVLLLLFLLFFVATRFLYLKNDVINPDGVNWHYRSEQFINGLKYQQFEKTYQHYHPGVMLMWVVGPTVEFIKQVSPENQVYDHTNFLMFHFYSRAALIGVQLVLTALAFYLLNKTMSFLKAFLVMVLFTFEPFFIGNSRLLHMDVLVTLFIFISLLFSFLGVKEKRTVYYVLSGIFLAFSFLTKSIAIGAFLFVLLFGLSMFISSKDYKNLKRFLVLTSLSFVVTTFVFFPALWVAPVETLINIFDEAERIGIRKGHGQIFFGNSTRDVGPLFYPVVFLMKVSPITLFGILFLIVSLCREKPNAFRNLLNKIPRIASSKSISFVVYTTIFYLGYLLVMTLPTKKIDRYMVVMFPYLALLSSLGLIYFFTNFVSWKAHVKKALMTVFFILFQVSLVRYFPYYFTYTSPLFINPVVAHSIIAQKPFGIGIPMLKEFIQEHYSAVFGEYPSLGFYDVKPMRAIYKNSQIYDIEVNGTSDYDILVLGPNEFIPEKVLKSKDVFVLDEVLYINRLPFWKIYVKEI